MDDLIYSMAEIMATPEFIDSAIDGCLSAVLTVSVFCVIATVLLTLAVIGTVMSAIDKESVPDIVMNGVTVVVLTAMVIGSVLLICSAASNAVEWARNPMGRTVEAITHRIDEI